MLKRISFLLAVALVFVGCENNSRPAMKKQEPFTMMQSPATDSCGEPYLFADDKGLVYLSWLEKKDNLYHLRFSTLINDTWSTPISVASGNNWFVNWADYPVIAASGDNLMAHYLQKSDSGTFTYDIRYITSSDKGKTWTSPRLLNEDGKKAEHGFVSIMPYEGRFILSWLDGRNTVDSGTAEHHGHSGHHGQMSLRAAILSQDGQREQEWEIDRRVCDCCQTSLAVGSQGPVVVYRDRSANEIRDIGISRLAGNTWSPPAIVFADNWKIEGCPVNGPRVDIKDSTLAVAWFTGKNDSGEVKIIFSNDGGLSFGIPVKVNALKTAGRVDLVLLDATSAAISWLEGSAINLAVVNVDGNVSKVYKVDGVSESRSGGFPQIAKSGNKIYIAWTDAKSKSIKTGSYSLNSD